MTRAVLAVAALVCGCPREQPPPSPVGATAQSASTAPDAAADLAPWIVGAGTVRRLAPGEAPPLRGYRVEAKAGDYVLSNAGVVAVVSAGTGRLLDFGAEGAEDAIVGIEPAVSLAADGIATERLELESAEPRAASSLATRWRIGKTSMVLHVTFAFAGRALGIESFVTSRDAAPSLWLGESVAWGNVPTWVEGHGFIGSAGSFDGAFVGRDALGVAHALGASGSTSARFPAPSPGFWQAARTAEDVGNAAGVSRRRVAWLTTGRSIGHAAMELPPVATDAARRAPREVTVPAIADFEVARCAGDAPGAPFAPFRASDAKLMLADCFVARYVAPGHASGPWVRIEELGTKPERDRPRAGRIAWKVTERGRGALPARVVVRGIAPTPDPSWGDDPIDGAALNVVYADRDGERAVPPGRYHVTVTRGFEYSARELDVDVADEKTTRFAVELERALDTRGWIAADLHLHAEPSPDAPTRLADRVRALVASGVEVGVATDHNRITDYAPTIRTLGVERWVTSIIGDEITTRGVYYGHFNVFPQVTGSALVPFENTTPHAIVADAHAAAPVDRDKVLQLNHPRMGDIGMFDILAFDPKDVAGWRSRTPVADLGFDAIEVYNGDLYHQLDEVEKCLRDWYALLDAGIRITATGNSDSHKIAFHEAGVPWNYVRVASDDPTKLDERAFVDAVRKGRVVVSSGPFVRITANGREIGETVPAGDADIAVRVDASPWVDVDRVELVGRGGAVLKTWQVKPSERSTRLDAKTKLTLAKGDWVIAVARGTKPMTFLHRPGAKPFAFTNPIFAGP